MTMMLMMMKMIRDTNIVYQTKKLQHGNSFGTQNKSNEETQTLKYIYEVDKRLPRNQIIFFCYLVCLVFDLFILFGEYDNDDDYDE